MGFDSSGALAQCLKCTNHTGLQVTFATTADFCAGTAVSHLHVASWPEVSLDADAWAAAPETVKFSQKGPHEVFELHFQLKAGLTSKLRDAAYSLVRLNVSKG